MIPHVGETERELAAAVAVYARGLASRIEAAEDAGAIPAGVIRELAALGVLGLTVPERDGGLGASSVAFALVLEELAAVWPSLAVAVSVNSGIVAGSIARLGTAEQRSRLLPRLMDGAGLGAFCLSEPSSGSDAASLRSVAEKEREGWRLDGQKVFVTNARYAPFLIVLARVGAAEPARPHAGITAFVVPADAACLVVGKPENKTGLLVSDTSGVTLDGVRVGEGAILGEVGRAFGAVAMAGLDAGRIGIAAQAVGIARGAIDRAGAYARERTQFGRPIASFQAVRFALAEARAEVDAARLLALRAAWLRDSGRPFTREAAQAKLFASEAANRATYTAVQTFGGYGYMREYAIERYARDARATTIYEGTSEIQRMVIARSLLERAA
ncbi:acyl-CoA dehydrogenase family protein [soil metagenome]